MTDIKENKNKPGKKTDEKNSQVDKVETKNKENKKAKDNDLDINTKKILQLEEDLENVRDEKLRLLAEMENLRKRSEREKIESIKFGSINLARNILSPCDNLSRALESLTDEEKNDKKNQGLIKGLKMVHQEIISILEKNGVKKIKSLNEKFDHNFHQAIAEIDSDKESGIILEELQPGYTMHDRLLRPSMVVVSKKKYQNEDKKDQNDEDK